MFRITWTSGPSSTPAKRTSPRAEEGVAPQRPVAFAEVDQELPETAQRIVHRDALPVEPRDLIVLVPGVVVPALRAPYLVAGQDHRDALRDHQQHGEVAELPLP